jgi:hypothetical protein
MIPEILNQLLPMVCMSHQLEVLLHKGNLLSDKQKRSLGTTYPFKATISLPFPNHHFCGGEVTKNQVPLQGSSAVSHAVNRH